VYNQPPTAESAERANALVSEMTRGEKIQLVTGYFGLPTSEDGRQIHPDDTTTLPAQAMPPPGALGSDGFVPGVPRLGICDLQLVGSGLGVTNVAHMPDGQATAFPSVLAQTASWDPEISLAFGRALGREARARGFNVMLAGAVNLAADPRCGRLFEYHGEDPLLAGTMVGRELDGTQDAGVVATVKHYAANFQETGRFVVNEVVAEQALREGELLAFELAVTGSRVAAVMTAYNKVNGVYASENRWLLSEVLKQEWGFAGWVMSDWGGVHSTEGSALAGLDQEFHLNEYFGAALEKAVEDGRVPPARLDDMVFRILHALIRVGVLDDPPEPSSGEIGGEMAVARRIADSSIVLLKNHDDLLPLSSASLRRVAVIGAHADVAVPSGGGAAAVDPLGGDPVSDPARTAFLRTSVWIPSSPLEALRQVAPDIEWLYDDGADLQRACETAAASDVAIVFAVQHASEHFDLPDLALPDGQEELIAQVAAANPHTVVVLETAGPITMPWIDSVPAVLEAWYSGHRGGPAIADVLFGVRAPSGRLPITFPSSVQQLPRPEITQPPTVGGRSDDEQLTQLTIFDNGQLTFDVDHVEGAALGYKWFQTRGLEPAFWFGHGLTYTNFAHTDPAVTVQNGAVTIRFAVTNVGDRAGVDVAQVYVQLPDAVDERHRRLAQWARVDLQPGENREIELSIDDRLLSVWDIGDRSWRRPMGSYTFGVARSAGDPGRTVTTDLAQPDSAQHV
jgi:beta-glucosidase